MGSYRMWVCDWCYGESRSKCPDDTPLRWTWVDEEVLCDECSAHRASALLKSFGERSASNQGKRLDK